jgi:4-hydroxybenzoate polyprenyltransferase
VGNIIAATLAVTPFFAVFIYFQNFDLVIFVHALFLYLIIIIRELVKDLENIKGDFAQDYPTLPVKFGEATSKLVISFLVLLTFAPVVLLLTKYEVGYMNYYFILSTFLLGLFIYFLWVSKSKIQYVWLHNLLKFIIVFGVACILLIDVDVVIKKLI